MDSLATGISHLPLCFSRNKLTYHVDAFDPLVTMRAGLLTYIEIHTPKSYQSAEFVKLAERVASERPMQMLSGAPFYYGTDFEIDSILDGLLSYCPPKYNQTQIMVCASMTIPFKVKSAIKNNTGVLGTITTSDTLFAIKAGLSTDQYPGWKDNFFTNYFDQNKPFLTFHPREKTIDREQPEFLYWLCNLLPKPSKVNVRVEVSFSDGSTSVLTPQFLVNPSQYTVYCIPVGFVTLGLDLLETDTKKVVDYQVWLSNDVNQRLTEIRTYTLETQYFPNTRYVIFVNSLGGYDTIRTTGTGQGSLKVNRTKGEKVLESNYQASSAEVFVTEITGKKVLNLNTGYFDGDQTAYLNELMFAKEIYLVSNDGFIPVTLNSDAYDYIQDNEDLAGRTFEFEFAKTENAFSDLPTAPQQTTRELVWIPSNPYCIYDPETGLTTGFQAASQLVLAYKDTGEKVKGVPPKDNFPGTEGYFAPALSSACSAGNAPFKNTVIAQKGTYTRNNCINSYGDYATITVPANTFGGQSQEEADNRAKARWAFLNTQEYANLYASCLAAPEFYTMNPQPPVNQFNYRYVTKPSTMNCQINGGLGAASGNNADLVFGNHWAIQNNTNPNSKVYPVGKNDILLPCGESYLLTIYGWDKSVRVKIYANGTSLATKTITPAEFQAGEGAYIYQISVAIPSQAKVFVLFETL
ncbi:DUF5977 domain-containing protein [Flectobacillus roseus]